MTDLASTIALLCLVATITFLLLTSVRRLSARLDDAVAYPAKRDIFSDREDDWT